MPLSHWSVILKRIFACAKLDLTHTGHKLLSARALAQEERCIKPEWVAMIKDHGALCLSPSICLEL